jgi:hypothetical protein
MTGTIGEGAPRCYKRRMHLLRFNVFGQVFLIAREGGEWKAWSAGADGKRAPAGFVIPDFIEEGELEQYLFDLFHESATPGQGDVRRIG